jgi:CheY-like chemotaxis protein
VKLGTACVVELPLEVCDQPEIVLDSGPEVICKIEEPITFLLIDDIAMNRIMFRRRVIKGIAPNATITEASTGEEALEICKEKIFDIIIVDQHMEEAGGVLLGTDTVLAMRRQKNKAIIIGCSGNDIDQEFMEAGSDWVMGKPTPANAIILREFKRLISERKGAVDGGSPGKSSALASHPKEEPEKKKRRLMVNGDE